MFETIFQHFINRNQLPERRLYDLRIFANYLETQNGFTKRRLKEVIQQFNYDTIKPDEQHQVFPHLEFFRGIDDFGSIVSLDYDGGVETFDKLEPVVKGQYEDSTVNIPDEVKIAPQKRRSAIKIDTQKYPISLLSYFNDLISETALFYTWISYLWQEIEGHTCGIKVSTLQNNSVAQFSLVDFLEDDFSQFCESDYGKKPPRVGRFFTRKLSFVELYLRASQSSYPYNSYKNYWRYFEKDGYFKEMVVYDCATGIRLGKLAEQTTAPIRQMEQHENPKAALLYLTAFTNYAIFDGWEEKFRPAELPQKMHPRAIDFGYWTGISWYSTEQKNRIPRVRILDFAGKYGLQLPPAFIEYLRLFNGRESNKHLMHFPINDLRTIQMEQFFSLKYLIENVEHSLKYAPDFLRIGKLVNGSFLYLNIHPESKNYGKVSIKSEGQPMQFGDYSFEKFALYPQHSPVYPEIFAAQENDVAFLQKRLNEGWDATTKYQYQSAIEEAASHNAHEALELLLKQGLRLRTTDHRSVTWEYDAKTMDILDKYPRK